MTIRTTSETFTFTKPFKLSNIDEIQPSGQYIVDTDEELIEGISRLAYRRVATRLHLPAIAASQAITQHVAIDRADFDRALVQDIDAAI
ncbi:hypothetical protein [Phreatobacter stygius]|uniref:Uncharacterized protein n=1 Tax=Phreatobacter stygius TaxID=1940610 RepID=A0A4D7AUR8_9HYPH|nr:hypothetical protein [Phreatobacter stygius]QCI63355.1 hypothetical protein E8M01_03345 [Phreatobacter stygius]